MRYEKADNLLHLALEMQAARGGLSLGEIEQRFGVGRRTAMRMRDAILRSFPQAEEVATDERVKRWRIPTGTLDKLVAFTPEELAALEAAVRLMDRENREDEAAELATLGAKLRALMRPDVARRVEPDMEALLEAEGLAMRPGPRPRIDADMLMVLRDAVKSCSKVEIEYRSRASGAFKPRLVHPYGFLHGHRHYLVAFHENAKANKVSLFTLAEIRSAKATEESFVRDPAFSLGEFARRSFGVFQEEPFTVVWRFLPDAAKEAARYVFHPDQETERQPDGSLIVRFTAGGELEMAWHLYAWGDKVEVLQPERLRNLVEGQRVAWSALP